MPNNRFFQEFIQWVVDNGILYERFALLAQHLEQYILDEVLISEGVTKQIVSRFDDVIQNCDTVDYNADGVVEAYTILHFMDRYRRFQLIYLKLLEHEVFPIKSFPIDILDVGTGPAPALFALSDIYLCLRRYGESISNENLMKLEFRPDYVEHSHRFREWLHHFTEFTYAQANMKLHENWVVPFQHGSFWNFQSTDFHKERIKLLQNEVDDVARDLEWESPQLIDHIKKDLVSPEWRNRYKYASSASVTSLPNQNRL